jgi:RNAse (barnase) inhibitor barstar
MVTRVTAGQFHRFMTSGRTCPALCGCEDATGEPAGDYVVKLLGGMEDGVDGLARELIGSRLASYFGIAVPPPALVNVEADFAELVAMREPARADILRNSVGLGFGSRQLSGVIGWPVDKPIPDAMLPAAATIFAFDALLQNTDRQFHNQNLFTRGNEIVVFDHELCFFLLDVATTTTPWRLDSQAYLTEHVFYRQLKSKRFDLSEFGVSLSALSDAQMNTIVAELPSEWNNEEVRSIEKYLRAVGNHAEEFIDEVRKWLK